MLAFDCKKYKKETPLQSKHHMLGTWLKHILVINYDIIVHYNAYKYDKQITLNAITIHSHLQT